jgi:DNA-binding NtrC family response regulator
MSLPFQEKILRVIEYQEFERVRGTKKIKVDVRVLSATNASLEELMEEDLFRRDLYDRITFAELQVPPLRHRKEDIPPLIVHFVSSLHEEMPNLPEKSFDSSTMEEMLEYYWPGNVRELKNVIERAYLYSSSDRILPHDLPPSVSGNQITGDTFHEKVEQFKKQLILEAVSASSGNQREAAAELKMTYDQFRHFYRKYGP